jgi:tetratricopeptide (TPR) repeat protein
VTIAPKFYVTEAFEADVGEVNGARVNGVSGQHELGDSIKFSQADLYSDTSEANDRLRQRTAILTEFTKALVYLASHNLPPSRQAIENAMQHAETYGNFQGKEVIYLFASHIARLQKDFAAAQAYLDTILTPNSNYARAYIAQANIYYDQQDYYHAVQLYEQSLQQPNLPYGAYIPEKANLGLANIYNVQFQYAIRNPEAAPSEVQHLAGCRKSPLRGINTPKTG